MTNSTELATRPTTDVVRAEEPNMLDLFREALTSDVVTPEKLEKLVDLKFRIDDRAARQEFNAAMHEFQKKCPPIPKGGTIKFVPKKGGRMVKTPYARLHEDIAPAIRDLLFELGLSYTFSQDYQGGDKVTARCTVRHVGGHEFTYDFTGSTAFNSPMMNGPQKVAAGNTFAKRQALIGAFSLPINDSPDIGGTEPETQGKVDRMRLADFKDALEAKYPDPDKLTRNITKIVDHYGVRTLADLTLAQVEEVTGMLS